MIFHHISLLDFVSKLILLDSGSPECITLPLPCRLSFFFRALALSICLWKGCTSLREFCDPVVWQRVYECAVPFRVTHAAKTFERRQGQRSLCFFLSGYFEHMKVCQSFFIFKGSRENEESWNRVPRGWCSISVSC